MICRLKQPVHLMAIIGILVLAPAMEATAKQARRHMVVRTPPSKYVDAPVPNKNILAPPDRDRWSKLTLDFAINHRDTPAIGLAYGPGSLYHRDDDRQFALPGFSVHIPLQ